MIRLSGYILAASLIAAGVPVLAAPLPTLNGDPVVLTSSVSSLTSEGLRHDVAMGGAVTSAPDTADVQSTDAGQADAPTLYFERRYVGLDDSSAAGEWQGDPVAAEQEP